jgi:hypothetical protein
MNELYTKTQFREKTKKKVYSLLDSTMYTSSALSFVINLDTKTKQKIIKI